MTEASQRHSSQRARIVRFDNVFAYLAIPIAAYITAMTLGMIVKWQSAMPFWDQWDELISGRTINLSWLLSQHNEHRILFPRLIFLMDFYLAAERNIVSGIAIVIIQISSCLLLFKLAVGAGLASKWIRLWACSLIFTFLFSAEQYINFVWGFQVQYVGVVLAAAAAFATLCLGPDNLRSLGLVVLFEVIATYTLASGIIVPLMAVLLAIWLGRSRITVGILAAAAFALIGAYMIGYHTLPANSDPMDAASSLGPIAAYIPTELGGPFGSMAKVVFGAPAIMISIVFGIMGMAAIAHIAWRMLRERPRPSPSEMALLALAVFAVGMTVLTAMGRVRFGLAQALAPRYGEPALVFWISLALLSAARSRGAPRILLIVMLTILPLQLLAAASETQFASYAGGIDFLRTRAIPPLLADVDDALLLRGAYSPDPERVLKERGVLRAAHTSVFHDDWAYWLGMPITRHVVLVSPANCDGEFSLAQRVSSDASPSWRATGHATIRGAGRPVRRILLADSSGVVIGFGVGGQDLRAQGRSPSPSEWIGSFSSRSPETVAAFGLWGKPPFACPLGTAKSFVNHVTAATSVDYRPPLANEIRNSLAAEAGR